jgi:hypothetical protein
MTIPEAARRSQMESTIQPPKSRLAWVPTPTHELKSERHEAHYPPTQHPLATSRAAVWSSTTTHHRRE